MNMRESQYAKSYLDGNRRRGWNKGLTIGSFLAYNLRGRAKDYMGNYTSALHSAMQRRELLGIAVAARSKLGQEAFYPADMPEALAERFKHKILTGR